MKKQLIMAAVALCLAAPAYADHHEGDMNKDGMKMKMHHDAKIKAMDTDGDGMISKAEWTAHHDAMWVKMDANADGSLDAEEMENPFWKRVGKNMKDEYREMKHDMKEMKNEMKHEMDAMDGEVDGDLDVDGE